MEGDECIQYKETWGKFYEQQRAADQGNRHLHKISKSKDSEYIFEKKVHISMPLTRKKKVSLLKTLLTKVY